jgi:beta-lactamase regulating signal transducer with metallopeptidase domain
VKLDLIAFLIRSLTVAGFGAVLLIALRRKSAEVRHLIALSALLAILAVGPLSLVRKVMPVTVFTTTVHADFRTDAEKLLSAPGLRSKVQEERLKQVAESFSDSANYTDPLSLLQLVWFAGLCLFLMKLATEAARIGLRISRSTAAELDCRYRVFTDPSAVVPMTAWWGSYVVLLPKTWPMWSEDRLKTVLDHEIAHIERLDLPAHFFGAIACAVSWPNPIAWWLLARARELAEHAVDDRIIENGADPSDYANDLLEIAVEGRAVRGLMAIPMATQSHLSRRIEMLVRNRRELGSVKPAGLISLGAAFGALTLCATGWSIVGTPAVMTPHLGAKPKLKTSPVPENPNFEIVTALYAVPSSIDYSALGQRTKSENGPSGWVDTAADSKIQRFIETNHLQPLVRRFESVPPDGREVDSKTWVDVKNPLSKITTVRFKVVSAKVVPKDPSVRSATYNLFVELTVAPNGKGPHTRWVVQQSSLSTAIPLGQSNYDFIRSPQDRSTDLLVVTLARDLPNELARP